MPESDEELNVLLLAGHFEVRGSSAYSLRLAERLPDHGISARIVCSDAQQVQADRRARIALLEYRRMQTPIWGRVVMDWISDDLSDDVPDIIHIQSRKILRRANWLAKELKRPYVLTVHDSLQPREKLAIDPTWCRHVIAVSEPVRMELLKNQKLSHDTVSVIHSGVDLPAEFGNPPVLDPGHVPVIGTAGPLEAVKGLPFFLGAAQQVLARRESVEFLIAGAGPEERNLRRLARDLGIAKHVTFVTNLLDFSQSLSAMDVFCLPSLRQGLGTIMLEAMARGKAVIASGVGGVYSIVRNNETGLVVPPSNSQQLADRIMELLDDPARARAIGQRARTQVQNEFGVDGMVGQTADVYRKFAQTKVTNGKSKAHA